MKKLVFIFAFLIVCLNSSKAIIAAETYPVVFQNSNIDAIEIQAVARNGVTYLPLRTLFEGCNTSVEWNPVQNSISAIRIDGVNIKFRILQNTVEITEQGKTNEFKMQPQCYIQNGTTYIPLRFAAEAMSCSVVWDENTETVYIKNGLVKVADNHGQNYIVNIINGNLFYDNGDQMVYLGNCGIAEHLTLANKAYGIPYNWQLDQTTNGSYILRCKYGFNGSMIHDIDFVSYMNFSREQVYCAASENNLFWQQSYNNFYLSDNEGYLLSIDDATGYVTKLDLKTMLNGVNGGEEITNIVPLAVDDNFIFFRSNLRTNLLMFDSIAKELLNFQDILLTDEVKAATGIPYDSDKWDKNFAPNEYSLELGPRFQFIRLENGTVYLELRTYMDIIVIPLEYTYR